MKKCAIFLVCDDKISFALGNLILQLSGYDFIDDILIVFESDNKKLKRTIKDIDNRVTFVDIQNKDIAKNIDFDIKTNSFTKEYGIMVFARFFALDFIDKYENIILMDVDTLIQAEFSELCDSFPLKWRRGNSLNSKIPCDDSHTYPNGGFICIGNDIIKYIDKDCTSFAFNMINKYCKLPSIDEFVWGILAYHFNIPVKLLNKNIYNTLPSWEGSRLSKIVHGMSIYKFWHSEASDFLFPQWRENNNKWNEICKKNGIKEYTKTNLDSKFSENTLFCFEFNYYIYDRLFSIHEDLIPKLTINCNFIKIYIRNMPHDFHFEVKKERTTYKIMIHDENKKRINNTLFESLFFNIFNNIKDTKTAKYDNRLEAYLYADFEDLKTKIIDTYENIKNKIYIYINCEKHFL